MKFMFSCSMVNTRMTKWRVSPIPEKKILSSDSSAGEEEEADAHKTLVFDHGKS